MLKRKFYSTFLFSTPKRPFLAGIGDQLNLAGNYYIFNNSSSEEETDTRALFSDWAIIGQYLDDTIKVLIPLEEKNDKEKQLELFE